MNLMHYKGYSGSIDFDPEEPTFFGKVEYIQALISYESSNAKGIQRAFQSAVDDYLKMCKHENIEPEKPFKGSFNIRTGHKLHKKLALAANHRATSINQYVCDILNRACDESAMLEPSPMDPHLKSPPSLSTHQNTTGSSGTQ